MNFVKNNGGVLVVLGFVAAFLVGYGEWRISEAVKVKLDEEGLAKAAQVEKLEEALAEQKELHNTDKEEWKRRIEKIVDILLEE